MPRFSRWFPGTLTVASLVWLACADRARDPLEPADEKDDALLPPLPGLIVSEPTSTPATSASGVTGGEVAFVSLPPGTIPQAVSVEIRNRSTGDPATAPIAVIDGGFDPVAIRASTGDTLDLNIRDAQGVTTVFSAIVPPRRPPSIVRTNPARGRTDVALNTRPVVIFSEPVDTRTLNTTSVRLLRGETPVNGTVSLLPGSAWTAEFTPASQLEPETTYELVVTGDIRDLDGDSLQAPASITFTTAARIESVVTQISVGSAHSCALTASGTAYCWGANPSGQLGNGRTTNSSAPVAVAGGFRFTSITSGAYHTCGITASGAAFCWGSNGGGQLGDGSPPTIDYYDGGYFFPPSFIPITVVGGHQFTMLTGGFSHTCGITTSGTAYCWGDNYGGQLGDGTTTKSSTPVAVSGGLRFTTLAAGQSHTCGLTSSGTAYCWGDNHTGQLGHPTVGRLPLPVSADVSFTAIAAGVEHTCGIAATGAAYCWGNNFYGQVGDGSIGTRALPVAVSGGLSFTSITANDSYHTCGLTGSGVAYCWGLNDDAQLGNGSTVNSPTPVSVAGASRFSAIVTNRQHTCALATSGSVYCWGKKDERLGSEPEDTRAPAPVSGARQLTVVHASGHHTCALDMNGAAFCWGDNRAGQLGNGSTARAALPVAVSGGLKFGSLATSGSHTCGLTDSGAAYCWGFNQDGQLGNGSFTNSSAPIAVAGGVSFSAIATGSDHTCALAGSGAAYCWGDGWAGQLGNGATRMLSPFPVAASAGIAFNAISAGDAFTCGLTSTGTAHCWGYNRFGQLGNRSFTNSATPVGVFGTSSFTALTTGAFHACGITSSGTAQCWGYNYYGQLGRGTFGYEMVPVLVAGFNGGL